MGDAGKAVDAREQLAMAAGIHEDMGQKSLAVAIRLGVKEIDTLRARAERAEAELAALRARVEAGPSSRVAPVDPTGAFTGGLVLAPECLVGQRVRLVAEGEDRG